MTESGTNKKAGKGTVKATAATPREAGTPASAIQGQTAKVVKETAAAGEAVVAQSTPAPAQIAETIEAVTSPAVESDTIQAQAIDNDPAPIIEEQIDMATVTSPTDAADKAQALFGDYSARFRNAFEKSSKLGEDMVDFAKGNVEAMIASSRVAAKAGESLGQEAAEYGKKHFEAATAALRSFATVKSPTELFQLQSDFAKTSFDAMVAEASRVSESLLKVAGDVAQPLSNRAALAAEKIKAATL